MLDALIGIVFIFLLISLICTALNEVIENFLKKRATDLEKGIRELLLPNNADDVNGLIKKFYEHPIISGLYKGTYIPGGRNLPSYIPASNFSHAVLDILLPATDTNLSGSAGGGSTVPSNTMQPKSLAPLRASILAWENLPAKKALIALIDAAGNDIDKARGNVEAWFNSSMDRVAGWYKRRLQKILLVLGFLLAFAMNADTIAIFKSLVNDPPLRNSLVSAAQEYVKTNSGEDSSKAMNRVDANAKKLYGLGLPIGWDWKDADPSMSNKKLAVPWTLLNSRREKFEAWLLKILGILLTALAVSLGSSFWFDTLNRIMVIRSTVKPHEKSPEEDSEDRQKK